MTLDDAFKQSDLLNLASLVDAQLVKSDGIRLSREKWSAEIRGSLNLSHDEFETGLEARCIFQISHNFAEALPKVYCREYWVKLDIDWHIAADGWTCYDLDLRWQKNVGAVLEREGARAAALYAAAWSLHHTRWLLFRHHYFYVHNYTEWPEDIKAWRHADRGRKEYLLNELKKHWQKQSKRKT